MTNYVKELAIAGIVVIVCVALYLGVDGVLLASAIGGIAGIAGYELGQKRGTTSQVEWEELEDGVKVEKKGKENGKPQY